MALLFCDGFDQYNADPYNLRHGGWIDLESTVYWNFDTVVPRTGTYALYRSIHGTRNQHMRRPIGKTVSTVGVGMGVRLSKMPSIPYVHAIFQLRDAANHPNITFFINTEGSLSVYRGDRGYGTLIATSATGIVRGETWSHFETQVTFHATTGSVVIRYNGVEVLNFSGNTVASSSEQYHSTTPSANCGIIALIGGNDNRSGNLAQEANSPASVTSFDDLYVYDMSGSYNNDWIGDRRVRLLLPTADTGVADWTGSYTDIDDLASDDDTTYVSVSAPGSPAESTSEFEVENLPGTVTGGTVAAVATLNRARKTEGQWTDLQAGVVSGASESKGAVHPLDVQYTNHQDVFETDPASGVAFTVSDVNGLKNQINRVR